MKLVYGELTVMKHCMVWPDSVLGLGLYLSSSWSCGKMNLRAIKCLGHSASGEGLKLRSITSDPTPRV
jgi:hypothetical protein